MSNTHNDYITIYTNDKCFINPNNTFGNIHFHHNYQRSPYIYIPLDITGNYPTNGLVLLIILVIVIAEYRIVVLS